MNLGRAFPTGGAFSGSYLADYLLETGHDLTVCDNPSLGRRRWMKITWEGANIDSCRQIFLISVHFARQCPGTTLLFHLGANTDVPRGNGDTRIDHDSCVMATYSVFVAVCSLIIQAHALCLKLRRVRLAP